MANRGVLYGSAFMNSFMQSYNKAQMMQADILRFKQDEKRYQEEKEFRREKFEWAKGKEVRRQAIEQSIMDSLEITQIGGRSAFRHIGTGREFERKPFKTGLSAIGKEIVPGIPSQLEIQATKDIKLLQGDIPATVKTSTLKRLRGNPSEVAREYLKNNEIPSLREILRKYPEATPIKGAWFDESRSPEDVEMGIREYVEQLVDIGYSAEEAMSIAEKEYKELEGEEYPRMETPATTAAQPQPITAQSDPLGIR